MWIWPTYVFFKGGGCLSFCKIIYVYTFLCSFSSVYNDTTLKRAKVSAVFDPLQSLLSGVDLKA